MRFKWLYIVGFVMIIAAPLALFLFGMRPSAIENRALTPLPTLTPADLTEVDTYDDLTDYVVDRLPGRDEAVELDAIIDYRFLGESPSPDVIIGTEGWLFLTDSVVGDCISSEQAADFVTEIERAHLIVGATGRDLVFAIAPNKAAIYPDRLSSGAARAACTTDARERIRSALESSPGAAVTAWADFAMVADDDPLYHRHDTHWNARGSARFSALIADSIEPGLSSSSVVIQTGEVPYEGDLTKLLGIPWSEPAPTVDTVREGLPVAETTDIELRHEFSARRSIRASSDVPVVPGRTLLLHDSFGIGLLKHISLFFADFTALKETHIDYEYVRPLLAEADTILLEKAERFMTAYVLGDRLSSKMASAFLEELDPVEAVVTITESSIEVESSPLAASDQSVYLVVVIDRTLGSISEVWNTATGPNEIRRLGGFRRRVAWRVPSETGPIELRGFPPDVGVEAFYVTVDAPPAVQE